MKELTITGGELSGLVNKLCRDISNSEWRPDYIVGICPTGLIPATMLSEYFKVPLHTLTVDLPNSYTESNGWMSEDALGYVPLEQRGDNGTQVDPSYRKKILIVDSINSSGDVIQWIISDWISSCLPNNPAWNIIWNKSVRTAVVINDENSNYEQISYTGKNINTLDEPVSVVFPWQRWWEQ